MNYGGGWGNKTTSRRAVSWTDALPGRGVSRQKNRARPRDARQVLCWRQLAMDARFRFVSDAKMIYRRITRRYAGDQTQMRGNQLVGCGTVAVVTPSIGEVGFLLRG